MKRIIGIIVALLMLAGTAHATVSSETARVKYTCNGVLTTYAYPFEILEDDDLQAIKTQTSSGAETTLVLNTDYTVTGAGNPAGGNLVLTAASKCGSGYTLTMLRNVELTQETDYVDGEAFSAESFEAALDKTTLVQQQQQEQLDRALKMPANMTVSGNPLPAPAAGNYIGWNSAGTALENKSTAIQMGALADSNQTYYPDADVADQAATTSSRSIASLLAAIGTSKKATIELAHSSTGNTTTYTIGQNADWSAYTNVTWKIQAGAILSIASGKTLTIGGPFEAGLSQKFSGSGNVIFSGYINAVEAVWFGATGDNSTDNFAAAVAAQNSITSGVVNFGTGMFKFATPIPAKSYITYRGVKAADSPATHFNGTTHGLKFTGQTDVTVEDIYFSSAGAGAMLYMHSGTNSNLTTRYLWVQAANNALYLESVAKLVGWTDYSSKFIYNRGWHLDFEDTGDTASISDIRFYSTKFDAQDNVAKAGLLRLQGGTIGIRFFDCLFQSASAQFAIYTSGNANLYFYNGLFYNNANDSQGVIDAGANIRLAPGASSVTFDGTFFYPPKSTATNFHAIKYIGSNSWALKVIFRNAIIDMTTTLGLMADNGQYPMNVEIDNVRFIGTPPAATYDFLGTIGGKMVRRNNNTADSSSQHIVTGLAQQVQTTDATVTTILGDQYNVQASTMYLVAYEVIGKNSDATVYGAYSGTEILAVAADKTITDVGALGDVNSVETDAGMGVVFSFPGSRGASAGWRLQVTGKAGTTINWVARVHVIAIGTSGFPI